MVNRPGSERKIILTPYFADVKEDIQMTGTPSCGELEYVITSEDAAKLDFVEIVDSDLLVYCDWYTKQTGTFTVDVASRLKWFVTEMS